MDQRFSTILGHEKQIAYLRSILDSGHCGQAYCFTGMKGLGKATLAKEFSALLLGLEPSKLHTSTNVTIVGEGINNQDESSISVDEIRELRSTLSLSTLGGGRKIAIIDNADAMTKSAQNALLKTLEEPSKDTVIILIAHNPQNLLETIRSRVATISFHSLPIVEIAGELKDRLTLSQDRADFLAQLSMGRPGVAFACIDEQTCTELETDANEALEFLQSPLYKRMVLVEKITKQKDGREQKVQSMIELWRMWLHEALLVLIDARDSKYVLPLAKSHSAESLRKALCALNQSQRAIDHNVNLALSLQFFASSF